MVIIQVLHIVVMDTEDVSDQTYVIVTTIGMDTIADIHMI